MAWLKQLGLRGVSLGEALSLRARGAAGRVVAITFDDGYLDNLREAAPILREFGFGATCYVVSGTLGTYNQWDADLLNARKPLMAADDLRAWLGEGLELGSHTRSHPHLDAIDAAQAEDEIAGSRADLERITGARIEHFCYPYGCYNDQIVKAVAAAGYRSAVTTERGRVTPDDDAYRLPRISINGNRSLLRFVLKAATPYGGWRKVKAAA